MSFYPISTLIPSKFEVFFKRFDSKLFFLILSFLVILGFADRKISMAKLVTSNGCKMTKIEKI